MKTVSVLKHKCRSCGAEEHFTGYICEICGKRYRYPGHAQRCEAKKLEPQKFFVGDAVRNVKPSAFCFGEHRDEQAYTFLGEIVEVKGPQPGPGSRFSLQDLEQIQEGVILREDANANHVFVYVVEFECPNCDRTLREEFYAQQLKKAKHK